MCSNLSSNHWALPHSAGHREAHQQRSLIEKKHKRTPQEVMQKRLCHTELVLYSFRIYIIVRCRSR